MIYTQKIQKAIKFAIKTHEVYQKQTRKGKDIAYTAHPLTVGIILSLAKASEDVIAAGILHDTIEDSVETKKVTSEMLTERFGKNVSDLVLSVTEQDKELSWDERKKIALEHIKNFSHDAILVKSADVLSNDLELVDDYRKEGDVVFERFNAPKDKKLKSQLRVIAALVECWPESPLAGDLLTLAKNLQSIGAVDFMTSNRARSIRYAEYNENMELECPVCGWKGTPKSSGWINTDSHVALDLHSSLNRNFAFYKNLVGS